MKTVIVALVVAAACSRLLAEQPAPAPPSPAAALVGHVKSHADGQAPHSIDLHALSQDRSALPIGVFDSGIGGLTVVESLLTLDAFNNETFEPGPDGKPDFAGERFVYFGDQANMPYGNYPAAGREDYLRQLIVEDAVFLLGKRWRPDATATPRFDKPPVKAIVIACNTATAYGIDDIRAALKAWGLGDVPVIGVVEAGARALATKLPPDGKRVSVGVLATVGTCSSNAYPRAIAQAAGRAGKPAPQVVQQGSQGLAGAIEGNPAFVWRGDSKRPVAYAGPDTQGHEGLNSVHDYASFDVNGLLKTLRADGAAHDDAPLRFVMLGCTHFPLAQREIADALAAQGMADVEFINPAEHTARQLFHDLAQGRLRAPGAKSSASAPVATFFFSVPNPKAPGVRLAGDGSLETAYQHNRPLADFDVESTVAIPLTPDRLPESTRGLVASLSAVWRQLQHPAAP